MHTERGNKCITEDKHIQTKLLMRFTNLFFSTVCSCRFLATIAIVEDDDEKLKTCS